MYFYWSIGLDGVGAGVGRLTLWGVVDDGGVAEVRGGGCSTIADAAIAAVVALEALHAFAQADVLSDVLGHFLAIALGYYLRGGLWLSLFYDQGDLDGQAVEMVECLWFDDLLSAEF